MNALTNLVKRPRFWVIVFYILFSINVITISLTQTYRSYEISVYDIYPIQCWVIFFVLLIGPLVSLYLTGFKVSNVFIQMVTLEILNVFIILLIPYLRGYTFYGAGDTHTHFSYIKDIIATGGLHDNYYPVVHIWISTLHYLTNLSPETISLFVPPILIIFYAVSIFLLLKIFRCNDVQRWFILSLALIPAFGPFTTSEYIMPSQFGFYLFPLLLFLCLKSRMGSGSAFRYSVILCIFIVVLPFLHPETTLFFLVSLFVLFTLFNISFFLPRLNIGCLNYFNHKSLLLFIMMVFAALFLWITATCAVSGQIKYAYKSLILNINPGQTVIDTVSGGFIASVPELLKIFVITYYPAILFLTAGLIFCLKSSLAVFRRKTILFEDIMLASLFFVLLIVNGFFLIKGSQIGLHVYRQVKYTILLGVITFGLMFVQYVPFSKRNVKNQLRSGILVLLVILFAAFSLINTFPSPIIHQSNCAGTDSQISGMNYVFHYRNDDFQICESMRRSYQTRFGPYLMGKNYDSKNIRDGYGLDILPPPHFGYDSQRYFGESINSSQYFLSYAPSKCVYPIMYPLQPDKWRMEPDDYQRLEYDPTVSHLYSNAGIDFYFVRLFRVA